MRSKLLSVFIVAAIAVLIPALALAGKESSKDNGYAKLLSGWLREGGVPAGEQVDHSVFVAGEEVEIAGDIDGDVWCVGQHVRITGTVTGDVICGGQQIEIEGSVVGSVRLAGETVRVQGAVVGNVSLMGRRLAIDDNAEVDGEVHLLGESATVNGIVGRDVIGTMKRLSIDGTVKRDVRVEVEKLTVLTPGTIEGGLYYRSGEQVAITGGQVKGKIEFIDASDDKQYRDWREESWLFKFKGNVRRLIAGLLIGGVLVWLWPSRVRSFSDMQRGKPLVTLLVGMATFAVLPVAFVILLFTLVGIPLALFFGLAFLGLACAAVPLAAITLGRLLLARFKSKRSDSLEYGLVAGLLTVFVLSFIPGARGFIFILALMWAWGVAVWGVFNRRSTVTQESSADSNRPVGGELSK